MVSYLHRHATVALEAALAVEAAVVEAVEIEDAIQVAAVQAVPVEATQTPTGLRMENDETGEPIIISAQQQLLSHRITAARLRCRERRNVARTFTAGTTATSTAVTTTTTTTPTSDQSYRYARSRPANVVQNAEALSHHQQKERRNRIHWNSDTTDVNHQPIFWSPRLSAILAGTRGTNTNDDNVVSPWHLLRGYEETLVRDIYSRAAADLADATVVQRTHAAYLVGRMRQQRRSCRPSEVAVAAASTTTPPSHRSAASRLDQDWATSTQTGGQVPVRSVLWNISPDDGRYTTTDLGSTVSDRPPVAFATCGRIRFPEPTGISVHMMPFVMGDVHSLPDGVQQYYSCIMSCPTQDAELGKVCYLTIHERLCREIEPDPTPRSVLLSGLHIEANTRPNEPCVFAAAVEAYHLSRGWAQGPDELHGGIFVASNRMGAHAVYNALVRDISDMDRFGGVEYLRPYIGEPHVMPANELIWLTDRTPHEEMEAVVPRVAVDSDEPCHHQFFRLTTSDISVWYEEYSTPNPLVPLPLYVETIKSKGSRSQYRSGKVSIIGGACDQEQ